MILLNIRYLLNEIFSTLYFNDIYHIKNLIIDILQNKHNLIQNIHNELIISKYVTKFNNDLEDKIIKDFYFSFNKNILVNTKNNKKFLLNEINTILKTYFFKQSIYALNNKFFLDIKKNINFNNISKYDFLIDDNYIIGIVNLDDNNIVTLSQFLYFCKKIELFITNRVNKFIIYPHEIKKLFQETHISSFRSLFLLYEARNNFLGQNHGKTVNYLTYTNHMINYMEKFGHSVRTTRNNDNMIIFLHL